MNKQNSLEKGLQIGDNVVCDQGDEKHITGMIYMVYKVDYDNYPIEFETELGPTNITNFSKTSFCRCDHCNKLRETALELQKSREQIKEVQDIKSVPPKTVKF